MINCFGTGVLFHGFYLGGVFFALSNGISATLIALIVSLQPILTSFLAKVFLNETLNSKEKVEEKTRHKEIAKRDRIDKEIDSLRIHLVLQRIYARFSEHFNTENAELHTYSILMITKVTNMR